MRLLLAAALFAACGPTVDGPARKGAEVALDYRLDSGGKVVEQSPVGEPLKVVLGSGELPKAVEDALMGAKPGDERVVELPAGAGFGPVDPALIESVPLASFGDLARQLKPGARVAGARGGKAQEATVVKLDGKSVLLDFNHPLAGKPLTYRLRVLSTRAP